MKYDLIHSLGSYPLKSLKKLLLENIFYSFAFMSRQIEAGNHIAAFSKKALK